MRFANTLAKADDPKADSDYISTPNSAMVDTDHIAPNQTMVDSDLTLIYNVQMNNFANMQAFE